MNTNTPDSLAALYQLARAVHWRYQLDQFEEGQLSELLAAYEAARREIMRRLHKPSLTEWGEKRAHALLDEVDAVLAGLHLPEAVAGLVAEAGTRSFAAHNDILGFGGQVKGFNSVALSSNQLKAMLGDLEVNGHTLTKWTQAALDQATEPIRRELAAGMILGEGFQALIRRLEEGLGVAKRDAVTVARTWVHNVNTSAQQAVYEANPDIVKGVIWCATLEPSSRNGHGTCLACAALDGQEWGMHDAHPSPPRHPRCRCFLRPKLAPWQELGLALEDIEDAARPYTKRPSQNIDAGGKRMINEVGQHHGDYASWFAEQSEAFQRNAVGPGRLALLKDGRVESLADLVDRDTGRMRTLNELIGRAQPPATWAPSGPVPGPMPAR